MLASVELKKRENRDDKDFLQMNGYIPCSIYMVSVGKGGGGVGSGGCHYVSQFCQDTRTKKLA